MGARILTRMDRRIPVAVGQVLTTLPGQPSLLGVARDSIGRLVACLDYGDHRTRMSWAALAKALLQHQPPPPVDDLEEIPAPMLAELPEAKRAAIIERYRDLLQIHTGSPRGNPDADRRAGLLAPEYDPLLTTREQRMEVKQGEFRARGQRSVSRATLYRQLQALDQGPDALIHGSRRTFSQRFESYDPRVLEIVRGEVTKDRQLPRKSRRKLLARIRVALNDAGVGEDLSVGQLGTLVGEVSRGMGLHHPAKTRRSEAARPSVEYGHLRVSRPGELVQIDATPTTVAVLGPDGV